MTIKLAIVDDQRLMREGLKTILELEEDFKIVGMAGNGKEACQLARAEDPHIMLMDIRMPVMDGVEATTNIKASSPEIKIIILTTFDDDELILDGLRAGAHTYLLKDLPADELIKMIRDTYSGNVVLQPHVAAKLIDRATSSGDDIHSKTDVELVEPLTKREQSVLALMADGMGNKDIAKKLFISEGTVKNYVSTIYSKLGINDRTEAVLYAIKQNLV